MDKHVRAAAVEVAGRLLKKKFINPKDINLPTEHYLAGMYFRLLERTRETDLDSRKSKSYIVSTANSVYLPHITDRVHTSGTHFRALGMIAEYLLDNHPEFPIAKISPYASMVFESHNEPKSRDNEGPGKLASRNMIIGKAVCKVCNAFGLLPTANDASRDKVNMNSGCCIVKEALDEGFLPLLGYKSVASVYNEFKKGKFELLIEAEDAFDLCDSYIETMLEKI